MAEDPKATCIVEQYIKTIDPNSGKDIGALVRKPGDNGPTVIITSSASPTEVSPDGLLGRTKVIDGGYAGLKSMKLQQLPEGGVAYEVNGERVRRDGSQLTESPEKVNYTNGVAGKSNASMAGHQLSLNAQGEAIQRFVQGVKTNCDVFKR